MTKVTAYVLVMTFTTLVGNQVMWAEESGEKEHAELAKALSSAKVSLGAGLTASASAGKPISGKFELEEGKLQLSEYTEKDGKFSEVVVDHQSGTAAKGEAITAGDDLTAAKSQSAAMAKAKRSLSEAVAKAAAANSGYQVVSVVPSLKDGHPIADVEIVKGGAWKTVTEKLD